MNILFFPGIGRQLLPADDLLHQLEEHPGPVLRQEAGQHAPERRGRLQQVQQHVSSNLNVLFLESCDIYQSKVISSLYLNAQLAPCKIPSTVVHLVDVLRKALS